MTNSQEANQPNRKRDLRTTLLCIQLLIPESENFTHAGIKSILTSIAYTPPECEPELWGRLVSLLEAHIPEPKEQWQIALACMVSDIPVQWAISAPSDRTEQQDGGGRAPGSSLPCVELPTIIHRPDFHCPTCNLGYFGPHWEQVDGKWKHVGRACKGTPSGYDRSYFRCKANYVDYFAEFQSSERNGE